MPDEPTLEDLVEKIETLESKVGELERDKKAMIKLMVSLVTQLRELSNKQLDEQTYRTRIWDIKKALEELG
jgi:chaperonin cofactor prefoldin